jgi:hypothetical protein
MRRRPQEPAEQQNRSEREREIWVRDRRLRARFARLDALPQRPFDDADMYDEQGLPKQP